MKAQPPISDPPKVEPAQAEAPEAEPPKPNETLGKGLARIATGVADLEAACKLLIERECALLEADRCFCTTKFSDDEAGWAIVELSSTERREAYFPAIHTSAGWAVFRPLITTQTSGMWGYYEFFDWRPAQVLDVVPGGDPEFVFSFDKVRDASDNAALASDATEVWSMTSICVREGALARCTRPLFEKYTRDTSRPRSAHSEYSATLVLGERVDVSKVSGERAWTEWPKSVLELTAGSHGLADLLAPESADPL